MGILKTKDPSWCESIEFDYLDNVYDADIICQCAPKLIPKSASVIIIQVNTFLKTMIICVESQNINQLQIYKYLCS